MQAGGSHPPFLGPGSQGHVSSPCPASAPPPKQVCALFMRQDTPRPRTRLRNEPGGGCAGKRGRGGVAAGGGATAEVGCAPGSTRLRVPRGRPWGVEAGARLGAGPWVGLPGGRVGGWGPSSSPGVLRSQPVRLSGRLLSSRPAYCPAAPCPSLCWHPRPQRPPSLCPRRRPTWPCGPRPLSPPRGRPASGPFLAGRDASPGRLSPGRALPVSAAAAQSTWGC